jgi:hypothetical protein
MRDTFDALNWSVSRRCLRCGWKFRCPLEQLNRLICRACESHAEAATQAQR